MKVWLVAIVLLFAFKNAKADDEFGDEEYGKDSGRRVIMRDNSFTREFGIFTIHSLKKFDKYILYPISVPYNLVTTRNMQLGVKNALNTVNRVGDTVNALAVASPQRFLSSTGYALLNSYIGIFGTANFAQQFEFQDHDIKIIDVLRFYEMPEVFFTVLGPLPVTLTTSSELGLKIVRAQYCNLVGGFVSDFGLGLINERALNSAAFDVAQKVKAEIIYEGLKNATYAKAKYFKLERTVFEPKKLSLKEHYETAEFLQ